MILDKLIEKKDIEIYIDNRIIFLEKETIIEVLKQKPEKRQIIKERFRGRIDELKKLDTVIKQDNLKVDSKKYYKLNNR